MVFLKVVLVGLASPRGLTVQCFPQEYFSPTPPFHFRVSSQISHPLRSTRVRSENLKNTCITRQELWRTLGTREHSHTLPGTRHNFSQTRPNWPELVRTGRNWVELLDIPHTPNLHTRRSPARQRTRGAQGPEGTETSRGVWGRARAPRHSQIARAPGCGGASPTAKRTAKVRAGGPAHAKSSRPPLVHRWGGGRREGDCCAHATARPP